MSRSVRPARAASAALAPVFGSVGPWGCAAAAGRAAGDGVEEGVPAAGAERARGAAGALVPVALTVTVPCIEGWIEQK